MDVIKKIDKPLVEVYFGGFAGSGSAARRHFLPGIALSKSGQHVWQRQ
jgi:hypothetical protein